MTTKTWRKSTRSSPQNTCVELAIEADATSIRDSKAPTAGTLTITPRGFATFLAIVKRP